MIDEKKLIEFINSKEFQMRFIRSPKSVQEILLEFIEEQPKIGEWIPCSERLPEDLVYVLVWFEYFRYGDYNRLFQTTGISYTYNGDWSGFVNSQSGWDKLKIIAWMPLPPEYKPQERNDLK